MKNILARLTDVGLKKQSESLEVLVDSQRNSHFRLPVMGGMKAGKSTLLARLMQVDEAFFPKDTVEATARNIQVMDGPLPMRTYLADDGNRVSVQDDVLWSQLVCGKSAVPASDLMIELPDPLLANNDLVFVDTPGNNTCDDYKATETWNALKDAQGGLYCLKATALLENTDLLFLQEAKYYLNDFIFVITRLDEAGCRDVHDELASRLVTSAQKRLLELGVKPLAVLPVSAMNPAGTANGLPELRECIQETLRVRSATLRAHQVFLRGSRLLEQARTELYNELQLLDRGTQTTQEQFRKQRAEFEGKLQDLETDKQNALHRLQLRIESLKLQSQKKVSEMSKIALERLENRLNVVKTYSEIGEVGDSIIRSEIDKWRQDIQIFLSGLPEQVAKEQITSSEDFCGRLKEVASSTLSVSLQIAIPSVEEDLDAQNHANVCLENIRRQQNELLQEMQAVQNELQRTGELAPELEKKFGEARQAVQSLRYEPVYDQVERQRNGGATSFLKRLGGIADIAMIFLPTSWFSILGKVGTAGTKLPKIANIVKNGSQLATAGKILTKSAPKGSSNPLQFLSFEHWGEKLGQLIDGPTSGEPEFVENQEHLQEYLTRKTELETAASQAEHERSQVLRRIEEMQRTKEKLESQNRQMDEEYTRLQKELQSLQVEMKAAGERKALLDWRQDAYAKVNKLFFAKNSELLQPVRLGLEGFFADCNTQASKDLEMRLTEMVNQVKDQLEQCQTAFGQDRTTQQNHRKCLEKQIQCLDDILKQPEDIWLVTGV